MTHLMRTRAYWLVLPLLLVVGAPVVHAQSRLIEAVKSGKPAAVRAALQPKPDVNAAEADGTTALHWAVQRNDTQTAQLLLSAGAKAQAANRYGVTPLSLAAQNGNAAIIDMLLKAGADANSVLPGGETALMTAARTGNADAVNVLIAHGANVSAIESARGQNALMWAAAEGNVEAIKALLAHGADIKARENGGWTAYLFAVRAGRTDAINALLAAGADVNEAVTPPAGAGRGRGRNAGAADGAGAGGGAPGRRGGGAGPTGGPNALQLAASNANYELGSKLLDKGANAKYSGQGWTPIFDVIPIRRSGHTAAPPPKGIGNVDSLEFVKKLVASGTDVNFRAAGRPPVSGPTALNLIGATAFFGAARTCDVPLMHLLVELGADPKIPNQDGTSPLLAAAGVGTASPGEDAGVEAECLEATKYALSLGNDINLVDKNGNTAMHGAAFKQYPSVAKFLAENGAKIEIWNKNNESGWTPLRIAVGVHRGMNFRFSEPTADAIREIHKAAGVSTEPAPETVISGATQTK